MLIMMVGTPGAGKTYNAMALCVVPALEAGRPVRTNVPLVETAIKARWPQADIGGLAVGDGEVWGAIPGGALVVVDEVGALWPSGQKVEAAGPAAEWLAMHRHRVGTVGGKAVSTDVVCISQGSTDVAGWVRSKIDRTYVLRKLDAVGASKRFRVDWYQGWTDSRKPTVRHHIGGGIGTYRPEVYQFYQSHSQADDGVEAVNVAELRPDGRRTIWGSWGVRAAGLGVVLVVAAVWHVWAKGGDFFIAGSSSAVAAAPGRAARVAPAAGELASPAAKAQPSAPALAPTTNPVEQLAEWRLSAWIGPDTKGRYSVVAMRGRDRRWLSSVECRISLSGEMGCLLDGGKVATSASGTVTDTWAAVNPGPAAGEGPSAGKTVPEGRGAPQVASGPVSTGLGHGVRPEDLAGLVRAAVRE